MKKRKKPVEIILYVLLGIVLFCLAVFIASAVVHIVREIRTESQPQAAAPAPEAQLSVPEEPVQQEPPAEEPENTIYIPVNIFDPEYQAQQDDTQTDASYDEDFVHVWVPPEGLEQPETGTVTTDGIPAVPESQNPAQENVQEQPQEGGQTSDDPPQEGGTATAVPEDPIHQYTGGSIGGNTGGSSGGAADSEPVYSTPDPEAEPEIAGGALLCDSFGRFTGLYMEDGRDEPVADVAAILVTNNSDRYLDYAELKYMVDGKPGVFKVTGLPAGRSAWVLEANRMTVGSGAAYAYVDSASSFRDDVIAYTDLLDLRYSDNMLFAINDSEETLEEVFLYYRVLHTDGNYLGGITYRVDFGSVEPGAMAEALAGHFDNANCEVVRVGWR